MCVFVFIPHSQFDIMHLLRFWQSNFENKNNVIPWYRFECRYQWPSNREKKPWFTIVSSSWALVNGQLKNRFFHHYVNRYYKNLNVKINLKDKIANETICIWYFHRVPFQMMYERDTFFKWNTSKNKAKLAFLFSFDLVTN